MFLNHVWKGEPFFDNDYVFLPLSPQKKAIQECKSYLNLAQEGKSVTEGSWTERAGCKNEQHSWGTIKTWVYQCIMHLISEKIQEWYQSWILCGRDDQQYVIP